MGDSAGGGNNTTLGGGHTTLGGGPKTGEDNRAGGEYRSGGGDGVGSGGLARSRSGEVLRSLRDSGLLTLPHVSTGHNYGEEEDDERDHLPLPDYTDHFKHGTVQTDGTFRPPPDRVALIYRYSVLTALP